MKRMKMQMSLTPLALATTIFLAMRVTIFWPVDVAMTRHVSATGSARMKPSWGQGEWQFRKMEQYQIANAY